MQNKTLQGPGTETVVAMTLDALRQFYPNELSQVELSGSQAPLDALLEKAGEQVVAFFRDFQNVSAKENVRVQHYFQDPAPPPSGNQPALLDGHHASYISNDGFNPATPAFSFRQIPVEQSGSFDYIILPGTGTTLVEYRTDKKNNPINEKTMPGFIMSSGHAGKCGYLHPSHQPNSIFRYLGREKKKPYAHIIAFSQKPEAGDYLTYYFDSESSKPIRILVQGLVWVHPDSFHILRIRTSMLQPETPVALKETIADVQYRKFNLNLSKELWLPDEINVSWEFRQMRARLIYRNRHRYSDYHLFSTSSDYKIAEPEIK